MCTTNKNKNKSAFRIDKKEGGGEKEESMFVILLIISHTLQIGVYCIGGREGGGYKMRGYKVVVGEWLGVCCGLCSVAVHSGTL